jgi:hypothetical protein
MDPNKSKTKKQTKQTKQTKSVVDDFTKIGIIPTSNSNSNSNTNKEEDKPFTKNGYVRPETTYTEQLSQEQIAEKLEDYKKVDDLYKIHLGTHLRYFSNINGKLVFRMGGILHNNNGLPEYVYLSTNTTGKPAWCVQVKDTIFYRKMTLPEIKVEYQTSINKLIEKNKKLKEKLAQYEKK